MGHLHFLLDEMGWHRVDYGALLRKMRLQWNCSITDSFGTKIFVLITEVLLASGGK